MAFGLGSTIDREAYDISATPEGYLLSGVAGHQVVGNLE